jgi:hypothetical protein
VPGTLSGLTYLLTARNDKNDAAPESQIFYTISAGTACTVYALVQADQPEPSWMGPDVWQKSPLQVTGDGHAYSVYSKFFSSGTIGLKRHRNSSCQGTGYVFKTADSGPGTVFMKRVYPARDGLGLKVFPNPFSTSVDVFVQRSTFSVLCNPEVQIFNINGKKVADLKSRRTQHAKRSTGYAWHAQDQPTGMYIITVKTGNRVISKRISLVK